MRQGYLHQLIASCEKTIIMNTAKDVRNKRQLARALGISYRSLLRKLEQHELRDIFREDENVVEMPQA